MMCQYPSLELAGHAAIVGLPVGYGPLAAAYVVVPYGLIWVLRRLALKPPEPPGAELLNVNSRLQSLLVGYSAVDG